MKPILRSFLTLTLGIMLGTAAYATPTRASGVVGTGTPASCTDAAFTAALVGGGLVTFNCGSNPVTIVITEKIINADTTIDGGGLITLSGNNANRHFFASPTYKLTLKNIALVKGKATAGGGAIEATGSTVTLDNVRVAESSAGDHGGGVVAEIDSIVTIKNSVIEGNAALKGGGVWVTSSGSLTVINSRIHNNVGTTGISLGGGIHALGPVTLTNAILEGNQALDGGGLYVSNGANVVVSNSTFTNNTGGYGGGIENNGHLTITGSTIHSNTVTGSGGGVWNLGGTISMTRSTVSNNTAFEGGGINSYSNAVALSDVNIVNNTANGNDGGGGIWHSGATFFATNITISGNRATNATGNGGGIYQNSSDNLFFVNATIANNSAGRFGGGIYHIARYGIFYNSTFGNNTAGVAGPAIYEDNGSGPGRVELGNSIIFGTANNCGGNMFNTSGHNIVQGTCASIAHATDQTVADAKMGAFGFNGGPSTGSGFPLNTFAPLTGSIAINFGDAAVCATYAPVDQRGAPRVGVCDTGAVEYGSSLPRAQLPIVIR